jgi:periplasmic protein TonB
MVIDDLNFNRSGARWGNYLVLSLLVNALIISVVSIDSKVISIPDTPLLKVKLISFKTPEPVPAKEVIPEIVTPIVEKKEIITEIKAKKKTVKQTKVETTVTPKTEDTEIVKNEVKPIAEKKPLIKKEIIEKENVAKNDNKESQSIAETINTITENSTNGATTEILDASYRKQTPPVYPRRALELGQQGNVILHALIKPDGFPSELKIKDSSGYSLLDKAALAAVRKWEFEPTHKDGTNIASWVRVPIEFVIQ